MYDGYATVASSCVDKSRECRTFPQKTPHYPKQHVRSAINISIEALHIIKMY